MTTLPDPASGPPPQRAWDQRLAALLVRPLARTRVHPNHITTLSLVFGLSSAYVFALPGEAMDWLAAPLFMLAVFTDHMDGELARLTGRHSDFGHRFDYYAGGLNYTALFISIGVGLYPEYGVPALLLGFAGGLCNPFTTYLRLHLEARAGHTAVAHPCWGGFEIEDFVYLVGPITWLYSVLYFFVPFALGSIGYLVWTAWVYARVLHGHHGSTER